MAPPGSQPAPAPKRGWVLPILWLLVVLDILFESLLFGLLQDRQLWDAGSAPPALGIAILAAFDIGLRIGLGLLVARDLKVLGSRRLRLAVVPATAFERTSPTQWGWLAAILVIPTALAISMVRGRVRSLASQAMSAPTFASKAELRAAMKKPGTFSEPVLKAVSGRQRLQMGVFVLAFALVSTLARL